ncbi:MAG: glycosyltransferase family 39 protein [Patescibacteria group bacterium]
MKKKLTEIVNSIKSNRKQCVFLTALLIFYLIYFCSRTLQVPDFIIGWFGGLYFGFCALFHPAFSAFLRKNVKKIIIATAAMYLIYSFFYYRTNSWDGGALYYRSAYLVKEKLHSDVLQGALNPYLSELILGIVGRFLGDNFMFFMFGLTSLSVLYIAYLLYKRLGFNSFVTKCSLLILASSSTYIMLSIHEFKVELFLLFFSNLFLLTLIKIIEKPCYRWFILLGLFASLSFLVKISVLPLILFAPVLVLSALVLRKELHLGHAVKYFGLFILSLLLPIFMWTLYTPTQLPIIGNVDLLNRKSHTNFVDLERKPQLLAECSNQSTQRDQSGWIYFKNELWILIQPFQFLFLVGLNKTQFVFHTGNPGPYIYFGIWLLPFVSLIFYRNKDLKKFLVYASTIPFIIIIYYMSKSVFWYFFPVYPLLATVIPVLAERYIKTGYATSVFKVTLLSLVFTHALWGFGTMATLANTVQNLRDSNPVIYDLSKQAQNLPGDSYILDAAQHQFIVFLPFMSNYDTRIVRSDFYFAGSGKSIDEMRQELLDKNIRYIIARKRTLFDSWYAGCPLRNNEILFQFLEKHTKQIYDSVYVGEIYEII